MKWVYASAGLTRQAFHKWRNTTKVTPIKTDPKKVIELARRIRKFHLPGLGIRKIYKFVRSNSQYDRQLIGWGKHSFEALCLENDLGIKSHRYIPKTTVHGAFKFENKIEGMVIFDINKIWVSDICYIFGVFGNLIGYSTSLIDLYSRMLLGLRFSESMRTNDTIIPALKQAYKLRPEKQYKQTYFHSDGGKQYIAQSFTTLLKKRNIISSMARSCYENPFAESFNDILKNHLLSEYEIKNFKALKRKEKFIKEVYNFNKTHSGIGDLTPAAFENKIQSLSIDKRIGLEIKTID